MNLAALSDRTGFDLIKRGRWHLLIDANIWNESWWPLLHRHITTDDSRAHRSLHAWSLPVELPVDRCTPVFAYLKLYQDVRRSMSLMDRLRPAKPVRAFLASRDLGGDGLRCPQVIALGENRSGAGNARSLFLTRAFPWPNLHQFALGLADMPNSKRRRCKRALVAALGRNVASLHDRGYVHGDLVTTNVLVDPTDPTALAFIDNDRTVRAGPVWRMRRQMRNLIQLNRHEFSTVTNADRLRFYETYAEARGWSRERTDKKARELAQRTVRRRRETVT